MSWTPEATEILHKRMRALLGLYGLKYRYFPGMFTDRRKAEPAAGLIYQGLRGLAEVVAEERGEKHVSRSTMFPLKAEEGSDVAADG